MQESTRTLAEQEEAVPSQSPAAEPRADYAPQAEAEGFRLSPQQERLWLAQSVAGDAAPFSARCLLIAEGDLRTDALATGLRTLVARHEILRTSFRRPQGMSLPVQVIADECDTCEVVMLDLSAHDPDTQRRELAALFAEAVSGFDLNREPLRRVTVARLAPGRHAIALSLPALYADRAGLENLARELARAYDEASGGAPSDAEPLQYADLAEWQHELLESEETEEGRRFWRERASAAPAPLRLDSEKRSQPGSPFAPRKLEASLDAETAASLRELAARTHAPLQTVLHACWQAFLSRLTGRADVPTGVVYDCRAHAEVRDALGLLARVLPFGANVAADMTLAQLVRHTDAAEHEAAKWQDYFTWPESATDASGASGEREEFCGFCFEWSPAAASTEGAGVRFLPASLDFRGERFKLKLLCREETAPDDEAVGGELTECEAHGGAHSVELHYDESRYEEGEAGALLARYLRLLESGAARPDAPLSELDILPDEERRRVLTEFNDTRTDFGPARTLAELFERQAERTPDAVALVREDERLTYAELNARSERLAHRLSELGVGAESLVGLFVERSVEMVVALLGVLKAGGAYVPLDPDYPRERVRFMAEDSGARLLLTQSRLAARLPECGARVVLLDGDWAEAASERAEEMRRAAPENLAYVIYTSGSTGRPKGVMVSHEAIANRLLWMQSECPLTSDDGVLQKTAFSFDASVWELFLPLITGARLVMARPGGHQDAAYLAEAVRSQGVTTLQLVPTMLAVMLDEPTFASCRGLRRMWCGGEAVSVELQRRFFSRFPAAELHNLYGPTETAIDASHWECERDTTRGYVPIGRPLSNLRAYVFDAGMKPVPVGATGELYVGGVQLARGYHHRPALTAEKFVPDPYSGEAGGRLYRTGDLARWGADGVLEYLGRADHQVKLRGFRIELGEVEAAMAAHEGVRECAAVVREDEAGHKRLVAYVVPRQGWAQSEDGAPGAYQENFEDLAYLRHGVSPRDGASRQPARPRELTAETLQAFVRERLPEHMTPTAFVLLKSLPLAPNGKLDRRALPAPELSVAPADSYVAPRDAAESALARIWEQILGVPRVGVHDNFFSLGGDSILSIQIVARANRQGLHLSPAMLFKHQTIAELAAVAGTTGAVRAEQGLVTGDVPLTPAQRWFFSLDVPVRDHWNQSVMLAPRGPLDEALLRTAVTQLFSHHDALRLRFASDGGGWRQLNAGDEEAAPLSVFDLSTLAEPEQRASVEREAAALQASLDIAAGPLARVAYFDFGAERPGRLFFVAHHLAVDGVSWRVLLEDLQQAYEQLSRGESVTLAPKTTSFRDWSRRLNEYAQTAAAREEISYWTTDARRAVRPLPIDAQGETNTVEHARAVSVRLTEEETDALLHRVPEVYNSQIGEALLSAVAQTFAGWTSEGSFLVDVEGHGREEEVVGDGDLSRTVGWFTSLYPVLLEVGAGARPADALKAVKEQLHEVPSRGIGYGLLRYLSQDDAAVAQLSSMPSAGVSFNYLGQFDQTFDDATLFAPAPERSGPTVCPSATRTHLLEITCVVGGGQLRVTWTYGERVHRRETIQALAESFVSHLRALIEHCLAPGPRALSPSDFPLAGINETQLERLVADGDDIEDIYPLSPLQEGMLFHTAYAPHSGVYIEQVGCTINGLLDADALAGAWQAVADRHAVLRTAFVWEGLDRPLQVIRRGVRVPVEVRDWRALPAAEREQRLSDFLREDRLRGFEPAVAPLMRLALLRTGEDAHYCVWSFHHLLLDGWCVRLLLGEVYAHVEALLRGEGLRVEPARPFRDYIAWLQGRREDEAEHYWRRALRGFTTPTPLGGAAPAEDPQREHKTSQVRLSQEAMDALQAFARRHQLTMNTIVQGAWAMALARHVGTDDVIFGTVVSGRPAELPGVETIVGSFINTLPVRVRVEPEAALLAWLRGLQAQQAEARIYEHTPLVRVKGWSELPAALPLFESLLTFENRPADIAPSRAREGEPSGVSIGGVFHFNRNSFPLTVVANPAGRLSFVASYDAARFEAATIARLLARLQRTLENMIANPDARVGEIESTTEDERAEEVEARRRKETAKVSRFKSVKPKAVQLSPAALVEKSHLAEGSTLPLVLRPAVADLDPFGWAASSREMIAAELLKHGAILFRGFALPTVGDFERFAEAIHPDLFSDYGDLPREEAGRKVYKSTPYPADRAILFHNESSHLRRWPLKQWFFCVTAAETGGETPIVDCRRVYSALDPSLVSKFAEKRLMYVRNFTDGLDVSWQEFFKTDDRDEVERLCRMAEVEFTWKANGLSTRQVCRAVAAHPRTGEPVFFNQLQLHHASRLGDETRAAMRALFAEEDYPRNVYYGDGTPIEDEVVEEIVRVYWESSVAFPWHAGDVLMLDNMLAAHGRNPFTGARKIVVAMGEMISDEDLKGSAK